MSLGILCGLILAAMPWAATGLSNQLGRARKENVSFAQLFRCVLTRRAASLLQRGMPAAFQWQVRRSPASARPPKSAPMHRRNKPNVNILSQSRVFLFGARDLWFEVGEAAKPAVLCSLPPRLLCPGTSR